MTRTLTLTPAEWEVLQRDGTAWIVREGEPSPDCAKNWPDASPGDYHPSCCRFPKSCSADVLFAPAELVAAAAPCATCRGEREVWATPADGPRQYKTSCPDCRITLVGECPTCRGRGRKWRGGAPCACEAPGCEWGTVTLGYAYADSAVLPIVGDGEIAGDFDYIEVVDGGEAYVWHWQPDDDDHTCGELVADDIVWEANRGRYALKVRLA